jgi:indolepyruvate ferredoxin oxidoreductase beta subunit
MEYNIVFTGVGGQGVLLASQVIGNAAFEADENVRLGEVHGMSQRGGSVIAHVRIGDDVYGPMVPVGKADVIVALEPMEALRHAEYLKEDGTMVVNFNTEDPLPVQEGQAEYPDEEILVEHLESFGNLVRVDADALAEEAGHRIVSNTVMIGLLQAVAGFPLDESAVTDALEAQVPADALEANLKAFELGRQQIDSDQAAPIDAV